MARPSLDKMKKRSRELAQQESQKQKREARAERNERKKSENGESSGLEIGAENSLPDETAPPHA